MGGCDSGSKWIVWWADYFSSPTEFLRFCPDSHHGRTNQCTNLFLGYTLEKGKNPEN
jgi:hypothetical protein